MSSRRVVRETVICLLAALVCGWISISYYAAALLVVAGGLVAVLFWVLHDSKRWLYIFLASLAVIPAVNLPSIGGTFSASDLLLIVGLFVLVIRRQHLSLSDSGRTALPLLFTVLFLIQALSVVASGVGVTEMVPSLLRVTRSFGVVIVLVIASHERWTTEQVNRFFAGFLVAAAIANMMTILQFLFQWDLFTSSDQYAWYGGQKYLRASGVFGEANQAGAFAAVTALLTLGFLETERRGVRRVMSMAGLGLALSALMMTSSRGALASLMVGVTILLFKFKNRSRRALLLLGGLSLAGLFSLNPDFGSYTLDRVFTSIVNLPSSADSILGGRLSNWGALLELAQESLFLGVGYRLLPVVASNIGIRTSDNNLIMALVETGVLGLVATVAILVYTVRRGFWLIRQQRPSAVAIGAAAMGYVVQGFVVDSLTYWRLVPVLFGFLEIETTLLKMGGVARDTADGGLSRDPVC